jgi:hypothetical protein
MTKATATRVEIPFLGLRYFDEDQADLFFGRDDQIYELLEKLRESRFVTVIGGSGTGKSSLVRAGLFPALRSGLLRGMSSHWHITKCTPGERPIRALANSIEEVFQASGVELTLRRGPLGLIEAAAQCGLARYENLLVFIDQFEEIFRYERVASSRAAAREEAAAFVRLVLEGALAETASIYVVLTMRSDYLGSASDFRDLPERINRGLYLIPRMTRDQIEEAIRGPIALAKARISASLAQRLLNDLGDSTDLLPVLQHAMLRTWLCWRDESSQGEPLDLQHYAKVGGLKRGLNNHANEIFDALPADYKPACEMLFRCVTERDAGERDVRRPAEVAVIARAAGVHPDVIREIARPFRAEGTTFLLPPPHVPIEENTKLDITHESLIRNWERLSGTAECKGWVNEEAELRDQFRELVKRARRKRSGEDLLRGRDLDEALQWRARGCTVGWAERYDPDPEAFRSVTAYIEESERKRRDEQEQARLAAENLKREREKRRRRRIFWALEAVFLALLVALAWSLWVGNKANRDLLRAQDLRASEALYARRNAEMAEMRERELQTDAEKQRGEAVRQQGIAQHQRKVAEALMQVSLAHDWFGQSDPAKIANGVQNLTALLRDPHAVPEGRLGAAEELRRTPLSALPRPAFDNLAVALRQSAQNDPDPKVESAAAEAIAVLNDQFLGEWRKLDAASDQVIASLSVKREAEGIQIEATGKCGNSDCTLNAYNLPSSTTSVTESYHWQAGGMVFTLSRGRTPTELAVLSSTLKPDGSPENDWKASALAAVTLGSIQVNVFDGARQPLTGPQILFIVLDGNQGQATRTFVKSSRILVKGLKIFDNFADNYTVIANATGYDQAGYTPVHISAAATQTVNLMLLRKDAAYNFRSAVWPALRQTRPELYRLLTSGAPGEAAARNRYQNLMESQPAALANLLNLTEAMSQISLPAGTLLGYLKQLIWDSSLSPSNVFAFASTKLLTDIRIAAARGQFMLEPHPRGFHPGATDGYKQVQFGEANVTLYFYGGERRTIDGVECVKISADIDYFKDLAAHLLVTMPTLPQKLDPQMAYRLRWMAAGHGGVPEFNPLYTIE